MISFTKSPAFLQQWKTISRIKCKNFIRRLVYDGYCIYKRKIAQRICYYDFQTIDIIKLLPKESVCIDIGANEGQIFQYMYRHCSKGKILAIEPIPDLIESLRAMYRNKRVEFIQLALWDKTEELKFYHFTKRKAVSGLRQRAIPLDAPCQELSVLARPLDAVFQYNRLDFIKIDAEGAEYHILNGAQRTLARFRPVIVFESGAGGLEYFGYSCEDLYELLYSLGYEVSSLTNFLNNRAPYSKKEFLENYRKKYDFQYVAYVPAASTGFFQQIKICAEG